MCATAARAYAYLSCRRRMRSLQTVFSIRRAQRWSAEECWWCNTGEGPCYLMSPLPAAGKDAAWSSRSVFVREKGTMDKAPQVKLHSTAHYFLEGLNDIGVEYLFSNLGTDHAPLIEEMARWKKDGR